MRDGCQMSGLFRFESEAQLDADKQTHPRNERPSFVDVR